jgi:hypothetical protein
LKKIIIVSLLLLAIGTWLWFSEQPAPPVAPPNVPIAVTPTPTPTPTPDPRIAALTSFFSRYHAVNPQPITDYLNAADANNLDYRILPSISIAESSGGQHACGNNWWGWKSCKGSDFASVADGVQYIDGQLASGTFYRGKTTEEKLRAYNPNPAYAVKVEQLMKEISNEP